LEPAYELNIGISLPPIWTQNWNHEKTLYLIRELGSLSTQVDFVFEKLTSRLNFVGLAYQDIGKDIMFRFIIEYSSLRDFDPEVIGLFLYEDF
jgi:hypothetical protein